MKASPVQPVQSGSMSESTWTRRRWIAGAGLGVLALSSAGVAEPRPRDGGIHADALDLLKIWCEGLLRNRIDAPSDPARHGALDCPACGRIHGRCGDAVLPLLEITARTDDVRFRDAALGLLDWMPNLDCPDGAWTNEPDPKSWKGTTVFTATMLAECLENHAGLLGEARVAALRKRLAAAGGFIAETIRVGYGNINYPAAATDTLHLLGKLLARPEWLERSRDLARQVMGLIAAGGRLLPGEGCPPAYRSPRGRIAVDLVYNIGESLPALTFHALRERNEPMMEVLLQSWRAHHAFMLPDGAWDNSWGTRAYKWTWWGGRTAETGLPAMMRLAAKAPEFVPAIKAQLGLLRSCTHDGLLHGGPHYRSHGLPPCIHHTFVMAKSLAALLHQPEPETPPAMPVRASRGVRGFPEIGVHLAECGPWRATVCTGDVVTRADLDPLSGGALALLWHQAAGPVLVASPLARKPIEEHNMQPWKGDPHKPLACRVEWLSTDGTWFTNLHDRAAIAEQSGDGIRLTARTSLKDHEGKNPPAGLVSLELTYHAAADVFILSVRPAAAGGVPWRLVLRIVASGDERAEPDGERGFVIHRNQGRVVIQSSHAIRPDPEIKGRLFHPVPGFQTIPLWIESSGMETIEVRIRYLR